MGEAAGASVSEQEAFDARYQLATQAELAVPQETDDGRKVIWKPQNGSQTDFMACPLFEVLYHGTRGPGKTDALLMSFCQYVNRGYGRSWRGIIFRQTYPQLADVVAKSEKWFRQIFPNARFNRSRMEWEWPAGEMLAFRHILRPEDYWNYHGHEYPFIGFEELTNWSDDACYTSMFACCRSSNPKVPRVVRATTNPYGVGHNWVRQRFGLHGKWWETVMTMNPTDSQGRPEPPRCAIHGHIDENKILLTADPNYKRTITAAATNEGMADAWLHGSWDVVAGGMFDDVWNPEFNCVPEFEIPSSWGIDRSFDWGSSRPFSVGWWAESDGSDLVLPSGAVMATVRGDLFRVYEWYGWNKRPNEGLRLLATEVAKGIVEREVGWKLRTTRRCRVRAGPADSSIFSSEHGTTIAQDMSQRVRLGKLSYPGVDWLAADKRPGSRKSGWEQMRTMIKAARAEPGLPRERPGLFVVESRCAQFLRTVPSLPRDDKDLDDVDTNAEDHIGDEVRYRVRFRGSEVRTSLTTGMY